MTQKFCLVFATLTLLILANTAHTQVSRLVHYQGELKTEEDAPFTGAVDLTFSLYDRPQSDTPIWSETHENVQVTDGRYDVLLGSVTPLKLSFYEYFLEVKAGGLESETKKMIVGSGYNFRIWFLFSAYTVVWVALFLYLLSITRRQKRIIRELETVKLR